MTFAKRVRENGGYIGAPAEITYEPLWSNTVLALSGRGNSGSTVLTDSSLYGNHFTGTSNVQISTGYGMFYGSSIYMNGSGPTELYDSDFGASGDPPFFFSAWYRPSAGGGSLINWTDGNAANTNVLGLNGANVVFRTNSVNLTGPSLTMGTTYFLEGGWDGQCRFLSVNGVLVAADATATHTPGGTPVCQIAGWSPNGLGNCTGYMNDLRFVIGVAPHTYSFSAPARDMLTSARSRPAGLWRV